MPATGRAVEFARTAKQGQRYHAALATVIAGFCHNISSVLDFEIKQKILCLVVEQVEFVENQITTKHMISISDYDCNSIDLATRPSSGLNFASRYSFDYIAPVFRNAGSLPFCQLKPFQEVTDSPVIVSSRDYPSGSHIVLRD